MANTLPTLVVPVEASIPIAAPTGPEWTATKTDVTSIKLGQRRTNLRSEGFVLDGATDETDALKTLLANASNGEVFVLDERANIVISDRVTASGKQQVGIVGYGDATLTCTVKQTLPILSFLTSPDSHVENLRIIGAETAFDGVLNSGAYALEFSSSDRPRVKDVRVNNVSRGLLVQSSQRPTVDGWTFLGMATSLGTNVNYHSSMLVNNSHDATLQRIHAENCGNCVLVGSTSQRGKIVQASGYNTFDNGIYISSGEGWEIVQPVFRADPAHTGNVGTGVKMRGSNNVVLGGYFDSMGIGVTITGTGAAAGDGYDGRGSRVIGARAIACRNVGFSIEEATTGVPNRDGLIAFCYIEGTGPNTLTDPSGIRVLTGRGHVVAFNTVIGGVAGTYAIDVRGQADMRMRDVTLAHNRVRTPFSGAYRLAYIDQATATGNVMENVTAAYGMMLSEAASCDVTGTKVMGIAPSTAGIRVEGASSTANVIYNNRRATISDAGTGTIKFGNANNNPSITGSRGGNAALASIASLGASLGLWTDGTTA